MEEFFRYRFGPFELDPGTFKLLRDDVVVPVEPKALDLLRLLLERRPRVVDKSEIFSIVWKDVAVSDNALTRLVTQLRKALEDDAKAPRYIETVATRGYRFSAEVTRVAPSVARPTNVRETVGGAAEPRAALPAAPRRVPRLADAAALLAALFASAWVGSRFVGSGPSAETWLTEEGVPDIMKLAALKPAQVTTGLGYDGFLAFAPDGKSIAYSSDRSDALEVYVQGVASGATATALTNNGRQNVQPAWSPDGQFIAYHEMAGNGIWVVPSRGGVARKVSDFGAHPAWSPDGRWLAFQSLPLLEIAGVSTPGALSTIWIVQISGHSQPVALTRPGQPEGPHLSPSWLPDSKHLLFAASSSLSAGGGTTLWNIDIETRQQQQVVAHKRLTPEYALAPSGGFIYFVARGANTMWWMPLGVNGTWKADPQPTGLPVNAPQIAHLAISPDGRRVGWTGVESRSHVWATGSGGGQANVAGAFPLAQALGVRYSLPAPASDGRVALIGSRAGSNINLFLLAPGAPLRQLTTAPGNHGGPQWMPGEREVAFITEEDEGPGYRSIDPETGRETPLFLLSDLPRPPGESQPSTAAPSTNIAFTRDFSRLVLAIVRDGRPNLWVAGLRHFHPDGTLVQRTFEREGGSYPAWSPDGRWIAYQCNEGTDTHVCVIGAEHGERAQLTHEPGQSWVGGWTSDSDRVLFAAKRAAVWNVAAVSRTTGVVQTLTRFTEPRAYVRYPRWDPANNRAVFERSETTGRIWSVDLP